MTNKKKQVLVGSPIYHKPHILQKFLLSLERLDVEGMEIGHFFIDDNEDERSRKFGYMTFWNETHYRVDELWCAHQYYRPFLVRYREGFECKWNDRPQHTGNVFELPHKLSDICLKHLGWVKEEDRMAKFKRFQGLEPDGTYGNTKHYLSIPDDAPNLVRFEE